MTSLQKQLKEETDRSDSLSEEFSSTQSRLQDLEHQTEEKTKSINSLTQEVERLRQEVRVLPLFLNWWLADCDPVACS